MTITQERLKELLTYNPETGVFRWRVARGKAKAGAVAGYSSKAGYVQIGVDGRLQLAHRLALIYMTGDCCGEVDHIDGNPSNNAISNLREVSSLGNSRNAARSKANRSGVTGVSFDPANRKWRATIRVEYKQVHIGRFASFDEAVAARKQAESRYGFHENHGSAR